MPRTAIIIGDGLAGALMSVLLARDGWRVRVYDRRPDPRSHGTGGGRSINLALSARGLFGLREAGLDHVVMERDAIPMPGRMIHGPDSSTTFMPYSKDRGDAINSVSRGGLNLTLIEQAAAHESITMVFDHLCVDVELDSATAVFRRQDGTLVRDAADLLIGADGAFSALRGAMQKTDRFEYAQTYLGHGYKELHIPPRDGAFVMEPHALHIWPRGGAMMIALPNRDASFTCTLFWPWEGEHSFASLRTDAEVRAHFERHYADALPLMPTLLHDYRVNPTSSLVTVRCWPWQRNGRCVLIGDAAHAIVPFYGQGINCGFEDCVELARSLRVHAPQGTDFSDALEAYQASRKPNADAIAEMALDNFIEMRDLSGRPGWQYRKKVEQALHALFPEHVEPQYNLVSFSTVPYTKARESGRRLAGVIEAVVAEVPDASRVTLGEERWLSRIREVGEPLVRSISSPRSALAVAKLIDISPAVSDAIGVWPGDTPYSREVLLETDRGDNITLSAIRTTVHLGSHADASTHYARTYEGARAIDAMPLMHYIGPCRVIAVSCSRHDGAEHAPSGAHRRITPRDVPDLCLVHEPRVLIRTGTFRDPDAWNSDFAGLSVELIDVLASRGVITIGVDTPSVDTQESKDLPAHRAIFRHGIAILEGLVLRDVEPGVYELFAQPLKLMGADASPVRAVLRPLQHP